MSELFPDSAMDSPSPRLRWLKLHNLALGELPDGTRFCVGQHNWIGYGSTHRDAELECAEAMEIKHYSVKEFERAVEKTTEDWS